MFYGSNVWDPQLIIAQIITVQCLFYISLGLIQAVTIGPTLGYITVAYIFDWGTLHFSSSLGMLNWISQVVNAIAGAAALAWVVERAKKCLDFGTTAYFWHLLFVCWYSGWPQSFSWWLANTSGLLIMVLLGEWLCVRREMQDIPLSIPQRLGSGFLSRARKASGIPMTPLATDDPDQPARPRLRAGLSTLQRSTAAAAATAAVGSSSSFTSTPAQGAAAAGTASPTPLPAAAARPGGAVQMTALAPPLQGGSSSSAGAQGSGSGGSISRKKLLLRPPSQSNMAGPKQQPAGAAAAAAAANGVGPSADAAEMA